VAAAIVVSVQTGSGSGSATDNVSGVDLISADNATNSLANRQANPITVGTSSYEKWIRAKVVTAPANYVQNFKVWGPGAAQASTTLWFTGAYVTYQQGTTGASTIANTSMANYTAGNKATWDSASYSNTNSYTKFMLLQLQVGADCNPGNWTTETISYSWDEA
jgi:hypothetical protein